MRQFTTKGFLALLSRFRKGQSNAQERSMMDIWYESLDDPETDAIPRQEGSPEKVWKRIIDRIETVPDTRPQPSFWHRRTVIHYMAAAVVLLVLGITVYWNVRQPWTRQAPNQTSRSSIVQVNRSNQPQSINLPDGSRVVLEPASELSYQADFNTATRTVELKGNAFFAVTKNKKVPFIVKTDVLTTRVLGTEFSIKKIKDSGETEVEVHTGKVQVNIRPDPAKSIRSPQQSVYLTANLKATYQPEKKELVTGLIADAKPVSQQAITTNAFVFKDSPLRNILDRLSDAYGVPIRVDNQEMLNCPVTADLSNEPLPVQLEIVVAALNARYSVSQAGVSIQGGSCRSAPYTP